APMGVFCRDMGGGAKSPRPRKGPSVVRPPSLLQPPASTSSIDLQHSDANYVASQYFRCRHRKPCLDNALQSFVPVFANPVTRSLRVLQCARPSLASRTRARDVRKDRSPERNGRGYSTYLAWLMAAGAYLLARIRTAGS